MNRLRLSALALVAGLASVSAAQAQDAPASPAGKTWPGGPDRAAMRQKMETRRAERLKALHEALNIRPDQESAFAAFAAFMQPPARGGGLDDMKGDRAALAAMTTPERLDRMSQMIDARMARMKASFQQRETATKALYAALNPDQKRTMDALPALARGGRMWGDRPGRGGPGRGGDMGRG
jgi:periplasmic protein CpxP/Spy